MWGIIISSPIILSIPLGAFLVRKYYGHRSIAVPAMILTIIFEGLIINTLFWLLLKGV